MSMGYNLFSQLANKRVFTSYGFKEAEKRKPEGEEATNTVLNLRRTFDFEALKTLVSYLCCKHMSLDF